MPKLLLLALCLLLSSTAFSNPLNAYKASYHAEIKKGLKLSGEAVRQLSQNKDGSWHYSFNVKTLPANINESTHFTYKDTVQPLNYEYKLSGMLIKDRKQKVVFNPKTQQLTERYKKQQWQLDFTPETQDRLSYQLQLQLDIASFIKSADSNTSKPPVLDYSVIHKGKFRNYRFQIIEQATIDTPIGTKDTVVVEKLRADQSKRHTRLWFDTSPPYALLRMIQEEEDGERYEINIKKLE